MHSVVPLLDASGRRRSPTAVPGFRAGKPLRNKGRWHPADPSSVDETVAVCAKPAVLLGNRLNSLDRRAVARRSAHQRDAIAERKVIWISAAVDYSSGIGKNNRRRILGGGTKLGLTNPC